MHKTRADFAEEEPIAKQERFMILKRKQLIGGLSNWKHMAKE